MKIIKKITGIILFILALFLSILFFITSFKSVFHCIDAFKRDLSVGIGYVFGSVVIIALMVLLVRFMFKWSLKLIRTKPEIEDSITEIGL
jgi:nitrate reductase gamma subunit